MNEGGDRSIRIRFERSGSGTGSGKPKKKNRLRKRKVTKMEGLRYMTKKYEETKKRILYLDALCDPTEEDREEERRLIKESNELMRSINELRRCPADVISYALRSDVRSSNRSSTETLRKDAAMYRFCTRAAKRREASGDRSGAEQMRNKAARYADRMSMIRRSSRRTISVPESEGSIQIKRPETGVQR